MNDYVNIETKTCFFGYGGIQVSTFFQSLILKGIKPPMGAGTRIIDPPVFNFDPPMNFIKTPDFNCKYKIADVMS